MRSPRYLNGGTLSPFPTEAGHHVTLRTEHRIDQLPFFIDGSPVAGQNAPEARRVQPQSYGEIIEMAEVGDLHHHYERRAV
jgi:hypothetical protein